MANDTRQWPAAQKLAFKFFFCWVLIFILSFSFPHFIIPDPGVNTHLFFEGIARWVGIHVFRLQPGFTAALVSDSTGFYIHALLTVIYALISMLVWTMADRNKKSYPLLLYFFYGILRYYLALQLLTYGFSKLFKWQFYLPEPNTLFTTVGDTYKDLLYWTSMGSSRGYSIFLGVSEVLAALLLLFRSTYRLGCLLTTGILINIVAVNLGFDIDVKLYSIFLLLLSIILLSSFAQPLIRFLFLKEPQPAAQPRLAYRSPKEKKIWFGMKFLLIALIVADSLYPYLRSGNFNDDKAKRPLFHGAYHVLSDSNAYNPYHWNRVFIHRQSYFISSDAAGNMQDYELAYDTANASLHINDYGHGNKYVLRYENHNDTLLRLKGRWNTDSIDIRLQKIDLSQLPLLQNEFSWTIDPPASPQKK